MYNWTATTPLHLSFYFQNSILPLEYLFSNLSVTVSPFLRSFIFVIADLKRRSFHRNFSRFGHCNCTRVTTSIQSFWTFSKTIVSIRLINNTSRENTNYKHQRVRFEYSTKSFIFFLNPQDFFLQILHHFLHYRRFSIELC